MAKKITKWVTEDGREFESELQALRHEAKYLTKKLKNNPKKEEYNFSSRHTDFHYMD